MRKLISSILFTVTFLAATAAAQTNPVQITGGRFFMKRGVSETNNARLETANFTAVSRVSDDGGNSAWDICSISSNPMFCKAGTFFSVPSYPIVHVGFCGACSPPQFPAGTFTINGTTYENVFFAGHFDFDTATFFFPRTVRRKGSLTFRDEFKMEGSLQVCRVVNELGCPAGEILFNGQITGHGTLTVTNLVRVADWTTPQYIFLSRDTIEYQFEP